MVMGALSWPNVSVSEYVAPSLLVIPFLVPSEKRACRFEYHTFLPVAPGCRLSPKHVRSGHQSHISSLLISSCMVVQPIFRVNTNQPLLLEE